ncbi:response regulator transcription factor [Vibrio rumoiensis]|uniref:Two-component system response regulator n=1 Tax=Vibrio rumoiensis 1S-45 TaxID=1188252 RepID=A0A1E5E6T1_9VIBR|nr:response regulator transcription factor [Vibrio rumoiensis]OEF30235.1 two-component system response regulator [Vibrio rumoiensis 1S-45]
MKVLIVDDTHSVVETIMDYLELEGIVADCAYHGESAIKLIQENHYDVIIMDIMMPKMDGITAVKTLRDELFCNTPILFLTAKDTLDDKIQAFNSGGDDFLNKPFAMEELCLRLRALHSRGPRIDVGQLNFADLTMNLQTNEASRANQPIKLSKIQRTIFKLLMQNAPAIVSKDAVISEVWGDESPSSDSLRSHIYGLRSALDKGFETSRLETLHGQGYRLKDD